MIEREPRYGVKEIKLVGSQPLVFELPFHADFIAFIDISEIDPNKVQVAFNEPHEYVSISSSIVARLPKPLIKRLLFKWDSDQEGKSLKVYYAGAPGIQIGVTTVGIGGDYVGLAKDSTLSSFKDLYETQLMKFIMYGRKDTGFDTKVYDTLVVKGNEKYIVILHRLPGSPNKYLAVFDHDGNLIAEKDVGCDTNFDVSDDYSKVVYFNKKTGYVEEADLPYLDNVVQLFTLSYSNANVKYVHPGTDLLLVSPRYESGDVAIVDRNGNVQSSISFTDVVFDAAIDPLNIYVVKDVNELRHIEMYKRSDLSLVASLRYFDGLGITIDFQPPFIYIGNERGYPIIMEWGGWIYGISPVPSNCVWRIGNMFVGTMFFSIFKFPMNFQIYRTPLARPHVKSVTIPAGGEYLLSIITRFGAKIYIKSDQAIDIYYRHCKHYTEAGYTKILCAEPIEWLEEQAATGVTYYSDIVNFDYFVTLRLVNPGSTDANVVIQWVS